MTEARASGGGPDIIEVRRAALRPLTCLEEGWALTTRPGAYWPLFGICALAVLMASLVGFLYPPLFCGIVLALREIEAGRTPKTGILTRGFDLFGPALGTWLIQTAIQFLIVLIPLVGFLAFLFRDGLEVAASEDFERDFLLWFLVWTLGISLFGILLQALFVFPLFLVADRGLGPLAAIRYGLKGSLANYGRVLLLLLASVVIVSAAALACYLPLFFVLPWVYAAQHRAYCQVYPEPPVDEVFE